MKLTFFSLVLLSLTANVYAQKTVSYISFFPPSNIVHNQVNLKQNTSSFSYDDLTSGVNTQDYEAREGGLILGSADNATITISDINIESEQEVDLPYAIKDFQVDNIVRVFSTGTINNIILGDNVEPGISVLLSANKIIWPLSIEYKESLAVTVNVENVAVVSNIQYAQKNSDTKFSTFIPGLQSGDKLEWRNLRINGSEECKKYLVKNPPAINQMTNTDGCRSPDWSSQEPPQQQDM